MRSGGKRFTVHVTRGAERDLASIYDHVADADGRERADQLLDRLVHVLERLSTFPERGSHPKELVGLGMHDYRQVVFKPYRCIYRIVGQDVYIYLVVDGRRDLQTLLMRRLLDV